MPSNLTKKNFRSKWLSCALCNRKRCTGPIHAPSQVRKHGGTKSSWKSQP